MKNFVDITKNKQIIVYGLGKSGLSCLKFLLNAGYNDIIAGDDNSQSILRAKNELANTAASEANVRFLNLDNIAQELKEGAIMVVAPGIPLFYPEEHRILTLAKEKSVRITCDIEFFHMVFEDVFSQDNIINVGVTGTNGKSTIVAMINHAFVDSDINSKIVGNFGIPIFDFADSFTNYFDLNKKFVIVNEISSFQLDLIDSKIFDVFVLSNITQDHLSRYDGFQSYIDSKMRVFDVTDNYENVIINIDDPVIQENISVRTVSFKKFSRADSSKSDILFKDGNLFLKYHEAEHFLNCSNLQLKGNHNIENLMACCTVIKLICEKFCLNLSIFDYLCSAAMSFSGLAHRMEFVKKHSNVGFVNDSKATNPESAINALNSFNNIFWIVGGDSKGCNFDSMSNAVKNVTQAYVIGENFQSVERFLKKNDVNYEICFNLDNAIEKSFSDALKHSNENNIVLLSPASSSLDQWKDYIQRGEYFCKKVNEI